jgi:hypothetical protein
MARTIMFVAIALVLMVGCLLLGVRLGGRIHMTLNVFQTTEPLELHAKNGTTGSLPAGTALYRYSVLPEITTYCVFVGLKERDILEGRGRTGVISPLAAFPVDE